MLVKQDFKTMSAQAIQNSVNLSPTTSLRAEKVLPEIVSEFCSDAAAISSSVEAVAFVANYHGRDPFNRYLAGNLTLEDNFLRAEKTQDEARLWLEGRIITRRKLDCIMGAFNAVIMDGEEQYPLALMTEYVAAVALGGIAIDSESPDLRRAVRNRMLSLAYQRKNESSPGVFPGFMFGNPHYLGSGDNQKVRSTAAYRATKAYFKANK